jgi:hypothetical protein
MVVVSTKNTRTSCNSLIAQRPVLQLLFILCFITLAYLYTLPSLSATSDFLDTITKAYALPLNTTSDSLVDNAVDNILPLVPNTTSTQYKRAQNCPKEIDGLHFIRERMAKRKTGDFPWQQSGFLNDKWGFYVFCKANGIRVPEIYMCSAEGPESLKDWKEPAGLGFVVKIKDGSASQGVYLMESGWGGREQISGEIMTREMVTENLRNQKHANGNIHAEELLKGPTTGVAPPDYKFYVANGEILYVAIVQNRGTDLECSGNYNEHFQRVDEHGCFGLNRNYRPPKQGQCSVSDAGGSVAPYQRCGDFARPKDWDKLITMAKKMSRIIGIFVRIDMYMHQGEVVMGEATFLPMKGQFHCFSKLDENGCVDPCLMGRFWKRQNDVFNNTEGGPITPEPASIKGWQQLSTKEKCKRVMEFSASSRSLPSN